MIGILGGSYDPVHFGHLRAGLEVKQALSLKQIRFVPSRHPPHREGPVATAEQRKTMLNLALQGDESMVVDAREYERDGPSYTLDTLESIKAETTETIGLVVGQDAFDSFAHWHRHQQVFDLAHIVVMTRPGYRPNISEEFKARMVSDYQQLTLHRSGKLCSCAVTEFGISSSQIRTWLKEGRDCSYLMPSKVLEFIQKEKLYR